MEISSGKPSAVPADRPNPQTPDPGKVTFTVMIPNYNHAKLLPKAIESVVTQSRQPEAIYVLDDVSTDNSVEVIRGFCERYPNVHLVQRKKNLGCDRNINTFIPLVETTFVFSLGADDYMLPGFMEGAATLLEKHPTAGICTSERITIMPDGSEKIYALNWSDKPAWLSPQELTRVARGSFTGQCFYNTKALQRIGGYPEALRWYADPFAGWVLAARHGACFLPVPGAVFRLSETSYSSVGLRSDAHQQVLLNYLEHIQRPEYADVKPIFRDAHLLAIFDKGLFSALWREPRNRYFLTPSFSWMLLRRQIRRRIRHPIPEPVKLWFRKQFKSKRAVANVSPSPQGRGPG